jgi:filamentous hemagglutinin family protein
MPNLTRQLSLLRSVKFLSTTSALSLALTPAIANPTGGQVVNGSVAITTPAASQMLINQATPTAIINWQSFSIASGESTRFAVPMGGSTLNRVVTGNPSSIYGSLSSNGRLILVNPNGIVVGPSGQIDTAGLILSTSNISDKDYLAGGDLKFSGKSNASIVNQGRITAVDGGDIFLIARKVDNQGTISAPGGTVGLAGGTEVLIKASDAGDGRLFVSPGRGKVSNSGTIEAATAELRAAGGNHYALAVNNTGVVRATGVSTQGGRVFLTADRGAISSSGTIAAHNSDGSGGKVMVSVKRPATAAPRKATAAPKAPDSIDISGLVDVASATGQGGAVTLEAQTIHLASTATIDASGATGGGSVFVGGGFHGADANIINAQNVTIDKGATIVADALASGNGGQVAIWSDGVTVFSGAISAQGGALGGDGGTVEVSGHQLMITGAVNTRAANGATGTLLLDPAAITISDDPDSVTNLNGGTLAGLLTTTNVIDAAATISVGTPTAGAHVIWNNGPGVAGTTLTLTAGAITVDASFGNVIVQNTQQSQSAAYLQTHQTTVNDFIQEHDAIVFNAPAITIGGPTQLHQIAIGAEFGNTVIGTPASAVVIASGNVDGASTQIGFDLSVLQGSGRAGGDYSRGNDFQLYHSTKDPSDPRYYSQVWTEHAHSGDITVNGLTVALTSGTEPLPASAYPMGNFVQIGHGGNANNATIGDATLGSPTDTSGYAVLDSNITINAGTSVIMTTGGGVPGMNGARAYVQVGHGVDNSVTNTQLIAAYNAAMALNPKTPPAMGVVQGDLSGNITINSPTVEVGDPALFSPPVVPPTARLGTQVEQVQVGSGGHVVYTGVALPATKDSGGNPVDPVEVTTGRVSGIIAITAPVSLSVGGVETLAGPAPNNSPTMPVVRMDKVGHGATVNVNVSDNGTDPSYGKIQTNIGSIGNFQTINGAYRNVVSFNNPYYQLYTDATSTTLNGVQFYTITYVDDGTGHVTEKITAGAPPVAMYDANGKLNTSLITYYGASDTVTIGGNPVSLAGKLRSVVGTVIQSNSGQPTATSLANGQVVNLSTATPTGDTATLKLDSNGNPIFLLAMDNAAGLQDTSGAAVLGARNPALIVAGTDYATNYRAYMPVTTANTAAGQPNIYVNTGDPSFVSGANVYGVQTLTPGGTGASNGLTAESLVAPRNAVSNTTDPTQMFVANPDAYNLANSYADGLLTPRINSYASASPDINVTAGAVMVQQGLISGNQTGNLVDQTQYAIIGNGNWTTATALTTVKPVANSQYADSTAVASNEDLTNGINTSSRGDLVVNEGFISGRVKVQSAALASVLATVGTGNQAAATNAYLTARIGDGSVFTMGTAGYGLASGADGTASLRPARGADVTINSADMLGASVNVNAIGAVAVTALAGQGNQALTASNTLVARIGDGVDAIIRTGNGGAGLNNAFFAGQTLGDAATSSARAGDVTFNRGSIWDGMILANANQSPNLATGTGTAGGVVVGGQLIDPVTKTYWSPDDNVYYTLVNGVYAVQARTPGQLPSGFAAAPTIFNSDTTVFSGASVILTSSVVQGNQGAVVSNAALGRIGQSDVLNFATGNGGTAIATNPPSLGAASGGRGGDITITQRIDSNNASVLGGSDSNRNLDGDFYNLYNASYTSAFQDVANGLRGNVHVSAPVVSVLSNVTTGNQGTASFNTASSLVGNGDDHVLTTGNGGNAGAGNQSGLNILDPAQGGSGGNINVLLGSAETQGNITIDGGVGARTTLLVTSIVLEGQQTLSNFNQTESNIGHSTRDSALAGYGGNGSGGVGNLLGSPANGTTGSFSADVRGGNGGSIYIETPVIDNRLDTAAQYVSSPYMGAPVTPLNLTYDSHFSHLGTSDIDIAALAVSVLANKVASANTTSPATGISDNIYAGIGSRSRVTAVAGVGGNGGVAPTGFNYGYQPDAAGGDGGDATAVLGLVRSNINIDSTGAVLVQTSLPKDAGGFLQIATQIGQNNDVYTHSALAGNGGSLIASGTIGATTIKGDVGGIQDLNLTGAKGLDGTTSSLTVKIIPTNADGSLNRGGVDNAIDISGTTPGGVTVNALGRAWTVADLASLGAAGNGSTSTVNNATPVVVGGVNIAVNLNAGAVILYDKQGNPQYQWDKPAGTWVSNAAFNAGLNLTNVLGADLGRTGALSVITFQGATANNNLTAGTSARVDVVDVNSSGRYDQIAGRNPVFTNAPATDVAYYGATNTSVIQGVLDYPVVATNTITTPLAPGAVRNVVTPTNYAGATSVVTPVLNAMNGGGLAQNFGVAPNGGYTLNSAVASGANGYVVTSSDFSRANGGRGGDATIQTGYTLGNINIATTLLTITDLVNPSPAGMGAGAASGDVSLPNDRYYARVGNGGIQLADTANTAIGTSWQAGKYFGPAVPPIPTADITNGNLPTDIANMIPTLQKAAPVITTSANGGTAGTGAIVAIGGRAGDTLIQLGSARPVTNAGLAGATEIDELTGAININATAVVVSSTMDNDWGGNIAIAAIGHGDQIFANANGSKMVPVPTTPGASSTMLSPWRAGSAIPGTAPAGNLGGNGNSTGGANTITEIASAGRGGNSTVNQAQNKGVITINAASVAVSTARGLLAVLPASPTPSFDDTLVAQIGHGSYATALSGNGGIGGDARMEASGGAGGNALVNFGATVDTGINIKTTGDQTVSTIAMEYQNQILRSQIGHGNIGFATAGFGGAGTLTSLASLHDNKFGYHLAQNAASLVDTPMPFNANAVGVPFNSASVTIPTSMTLIHAVEATTTAPAGVYLQAAPAVGGQIGMTANGGAGGSATVGSGLSNAAGSQLALANAAAFTTSGVINNAIALTVGGNLLVSSKVGELLGTNTYLSLDDHALAAIGSGNYGLAVSGAGGDAALGAGVTNIPASMNGGASGTSTVAYGNIGQSIVRPANVANGGTYVDSVDATMGAPINLSFTNGGLLTVISNSGDQATGTLDPLDNAIRSNVAVIGASDFTYADSTYAKGGNASLAAAGIGSANGGNGGAAVATDGSFFGAINIGIVPTDPNAPISATNPAITGLPSIVSVTANETTALDIGRADANIGDFRQAEARAGQGDLAGVLTAVGGKGGNAKDYAISEYDNYDPATHQWYGVGFGAGTIAGPSTIQPNQPDWYPVNQRATALGGNGGAASVTLGEIDSDLSVKASASVLVQALETLPPTLPGTIPDMVMTNARIGTSDRTKAVAANGGLGGTANTAPNGYQFGTVGNASLASANNVLPIGLANDASSGGTNLTGGTVKKSVDALAAKGGDGGAASVDNGAQIGAITVTAPVVAVTALQTAVALSNGIAQTAQIGHYDYNLLTLAGDGGLSTAGRGGDGGAASLTQRGFGGDVTVTGTTSVTVSAISNLGIADMTSAYIGDRETAGVHLLLPNLTGIVNPLYFSGGVFGGQGAQDGNGGAVTVNQIGTVSRTLFANGGASGVKVLNDTTNDIYLLSRVLTPTKVNGATVGLATSGGTVTVDAESLAADTSLVTAHVGHSIDLVQAKAGNGVAGGPAGAAPYIQENGVEYLSGKGGDLTVGQGPILANIVLDAYGDTTVTSNAVLGLTANAIVGNYTLIGTNLPGATVTPNGLGLTVFPVVTSGNGAAVNTSLANTSTTGASGSYATAAAGTGDGGAVSITQGALTGAILIQSDTGNTSVTANSAVGTATTLVGAERGLNVLSGNGGSLGGDAGPITIARGDINGDISIVSFNGKTTAITSTGAASLASVVVGVRETETATGGNGGGAVDQSGLAGALNAFGAATPNAAGGKLDDVRLAVREMEQAIAAMTEAQNKATAIGDGASAAAIGAQIATAKAALTAATNAKDAPAVANSNALPNDPVKAAAVTAAIQTIQNSAKTVATAATAVANTTVTNASTKVAGKIGLTDPGAGGSVTYTGAGLVASRVNVLATASTAVSNLNDPTTGLPLPLNATTGAPTQSGTVAIASNGVAAATNVQIGTSRAMTNVSGDGGATVGIPGAITQTNTTTGDINVIGGVTSVISTVLGATRVGDNVAVKDTSGTANVGTALQQGGAINSTSTIGTTTPATSETANIQIISQVGDNVIGSALNAGGSVQVGQNSTSSLNTDNPAAAVSTLTTASQTTSGSINVISKGATQVVSGAGVTTQVGDTINENGNLLSSKAVLAGSSAVQTVNAPINVDVGTNLKVDGTGGGNLLIGHSSPVDNAGLVGVSTEQLNGDITVNVNTVVASAPVLHTVAIAQIPVGSTPNADPSTANPANTSPTGVGVAPVVTDLLKGVTLSKADGSATAQNGGDTSIVGTGANTRIGTTFTSNPANDVQTTNNSVWLGTGADLLVSKAAVGPGNYNTASLAPTTTNGANPANSTNGTSRNRIVGNTTIGAAQNTPAFNQDTKIAGAMTFDNSQITSGYAGVGGAGQLRFFTPSRENVVTTGANVFNDSAATSGNDVVPVRASSNNYIFSGSGGQQHENGFQPMSTSANYSAIGTGNYAFYFDQPARPAAGGKLVFPGLLWRLFEPYGSIRDDIRGGMDCGLLVGGSGSLGLGSIGRNSIEQSSGFAIGYAGGNRRLRTIVNGYAGANSAGMFGGFGPSGACGAGQTTGTEAPNAPGEQASSPGQGAPPPQTTGASGQPPVVRATRVADASPIFLGLSSGPHSIRALSFSASGLAPLPATH